MYIDIGVLLGESRNINIIWGIGWRMGVDAEMI